VYFERIHVENSAFLSDFTNSFPLQGAHVTLVNVTFDSPMGINNQTITKLQTCSFTNVTMRCPVPQQLWRCFGNATVSPPCTPSRTPFYTYRTHLLRCSVYGVCDATCFDPVAPGHQCPWTNGFRKYLPATLGFSTIELALGLPNEAKSLYVGSVKSTAGYVAKVELLDWRASPPAWAVVFDRLPVREVGVNTDIVTLPPILTNRVRVTLEQWLDTDAIDRVDLFTEVWPERAPPPQPRKGKCPTATSTNSRSMLDETIGDSFCLGRVCQMACEYPAANWTFARVVKARFLVLEGGEQWSGGKLVATPSDETRVYELDGNETDFFNITSDVRRARLVGDPVTGGLPVPTLPNRLGLPGVLVKTWRRTRPSGGEVVGAGNITAPANETIVSAVTVLNQTFATT
ncbi:MAG: hypothetical protein IV100_31840, partial [Myxococcales bacterium]|nr:hypothetical protein [Myxococcales bacterium]